MYVGPQLDGLDGEVGDDAPEGADADVPDVPDVSREWERLRTDGEEGGIVSDASDRGLDAVGLEGLIWGEKES